MSVFTEWVYGPEDEVYNALLLKSINESLLYEKVEVPIEVSVMLVDNNEIQTINMEQRGIDKATDVLSFPMITFEIYESINEAITDQYKNPDNGEYYLGDMVISWDKVVEQSVAYGHSIERELAFLCVHSMLHLLGYDHMNVADEKVMQLKQKEILEKMGLKR